MILLGCRIPSLPTGRPRIVPAGTRAAKARRVGAELDRIEGRLRVRGLRVPIGREEARHLAALLAYWKFLVWRTP